MQLRRLHLQNFRQHVNNTIEFRPGITGIIGPNGAGKSTILEAIAWCVYGASAARGNNDGIRFSRATPRAKVVAELIFDLDTHEYKVTRTLNSAEVYLDNGLNPVATGVGAVTSYLQNKLGMTKQEFFNTYFTGQKELQFLAHMGPTDRGRFLAQVLGYERLRRAQEIARGKRKELNAKSEGLRAGLPDPEELKKEREQADKRVKAALKEANAAEKARAKAEKDLAEAAPAWQVAQETREKAQRLIVELESATREHEVAQKEVERAVAELARIDAAAEKLQSLAPQIAELAEVTERNQQLEELARVNARKSVLQQNEAQIVAEIKKLEATLEGLKQAPALLKKAQEELAELKKALPDAESLREGLFKKWREDAQHNRTALTMTQDAEKELAAQIDKLEKTGEAGDCPVCARPLGDEYDSVLVHLQEELASRRSDIKWRTNVEKQLKDQPKELIEADKILHQMRDAIEKKTEREARCEQGVKDLWERTEELQARRKQLEEVRRELAEIPADYDKDQHTLVRLRLNELQAIARQATVLEHEVERRAARADDVLIAQAHLAVVMTRETTTRDALKSLRYDEKGYEKERERFHKLTAMEYQANIAATATAQQLKAAQESIAVIDRAEAVYKEKQATLVELESELRHHEAMDNALTQLRTELNARVRPELSELASSFLSDITEGRYSALDIDEAYNIVVLEDGEEKPVISGGEQDVADLVLRIAISQMIAERAGQQLSTLFLDEVFGSLDLERRENVIQLLQKLHDHFEQVILITHIETVREGLDHVIRLEYDEKSGSSVVREEEEQFELVGS
jgi:exonuclease SbcC